MRLKKEAIAITGFILLILSVIVQSRIEQITGAAAGGAKICVGYTPSLDPIGNLNATTEIAFEYDVNHTMTSGSVNYADNTTLFSIDQSTGIISFTPQEANVGNHSITITANNSACSNLGDYEIISFEIIQGNRAPVLETIDNYTVFEDTSINIDINATDADGDNITYACNTTLFTVNETTGIIDWAPTNDNVGLNWFDCNATDDYGASDSQIFSITVTNVNDAPILDTISNFTVESGSPLYEDTAFEYDVNATDPDGDTIEYLDNTSLFVTNSVTGVIAFTPTNLQVGNYSVEIYASDGTNIAQQVVLFEILAVNDPPTLGAIGAQTAKANSEFCVFVNASDEEDGINLIEGGSNLTFNVDTSLFGINPTTGGACFTPAEGSIGNYSINFTVTDNGIPEYGLGNASDSEVVSFSITEANRAPNITSYSPETPVSMQAGTSQDSTITAEDPDGGTPSAQWYLNGSAITDATSYTYKFTPSSAGTYNLSVVVSDGELTDIQEWTITVPTLSGLAAPAGGGSFGGKYHCKETWVCTDWSTCMIKDIQLRTCKDLKECATKVNKPPEMRTCIFVPVETCFDGIRNQDEIIPDCGGACNPCPTCNDGICNQGEQCEICDEEPNRCPLNIDGKIMPDCGGPCPLCPKIEKPLRPKGYDFKGLAIKATKISITSILILLVVLIAFVRIMRYISKRSILTEQELSEIGIVKRIEELIKDAEEAVDAKDIKALKATCADIETLYNRLSSTRNKKKVYPKISRLKRAIKIGL